ncbi:zinc finger protein 62 homolog isoform X2 [Xenia sp. Carnegie-2017]|uniref:zinc finger protein 62 homolog isoform X2 n=1 Tax=Xenia sp. Carnegie-2017 TaxID=2897299 RepID=UPI001F047E38|nr:zinc finger protein 62 homolog isoform X2 [Xenia sp. Carnegie-2017]
MSRHRLHPECTGRVEADAVSVERARTKICGSCSKHFVQGERPAYQCLACDFYVCVNCERPIYHPAHPENALYLTIKKSSWRCDVCRKSSIDLKDKRFYSCDESYFKMCVDCSKEIRTTLHPHPLLHTDTRYTYPQTNGEWNCDICRNNNGPGHYYPAHCALSCEFDLCDNCLKPYRSTFHPAHAMYKADSNVVYASFNGGWRCDRCSQSFNPHNNNIPYHCSICEFDLCESCMKTTADPSNAAGFDVARPEVQPGLVNFLILRHERIKWIYIYVEILQ